MECDIDNSNTINEINKEKAFVRLYKLQLFLKKESALKELCKNIILKILIFIKSFRYKNKR